MASKTEIFNLALDAAGNRHTVASPTEVSREAQTCNRWYDITLDQILRAAPWPSTRAVSRLAVLATRNDSLNWTATAPDPGFIYAYSTPIDMLYPRHFFGFTRFHLGVFAGQKAISSNTENAILVYTKREENFDLWDPDLYMAVIHALAANITMPLQGKPARAQLNAEKANSLLIQAQVNAANLDEAGWDVVPEWLLARGFSTASSVNRYIYPTGPLIALSEFTGVS